MIDGPNYVARFASFVFNWRRDPQLALWATDIPPALRASPANIRSDPTVELTGRARNLDRRKLSMRSRLTRAPVQ
jgi:hypothetical protein